MNLSSPLMRRLLLADAILCAVAGAVLLADASLVAPLVGVTESTLRMVGGALLPVAAVLAYVARRPAPLRPA